MGAYFNEMKVDGSKTRNEVKEIFSDAQDTDRYENGHSYSGGFGMASGLKFPEKTFKSEDEALDWLQDNAQKWREALAVTVKEDDKPACWLIGAWCAS